MSTELFKKDLTPLPDPVPDPAKDYVSELVGDGKKFKTVADLAKGKIESDNFIERILAEQQELRDDLKARKNLEELVKDLETAQALKPPISASNESETPDRERDNVKVITSEDIEKMLDQTLTKRDQNQVLTTNLNLVKNVLQKTLGNDFPEKLREKARQIDSNLTEEDLNNLAARSPRTFFKLLDIKEDTPIQQSFVPTESSINSAGIPRSDSNEKTESYYKRLKETDKVGYFSSATQNQMYKDAMRLGERFFDTNK